MLHKYECFFFLENWQFNHKLGPPVSPTNILCLKNYPHNLTKYEMKGTSKTPISLLFSEFGSATLAYIQKKQCSIFLWIGKNWEVKLEQHSKIPKSLCVLGKTWKSNLRPTLKNLNFESMDKEKWCPNLRFTLENKI